jgi:hypothetical protein
MGKMPSRCCGFRPNETLLLVDFGFSLSDTQLVMLDAAVVSTNTIGWSVDVQLGGLVRAISH